MIIKSLFCFHEELVFTHMYIYRHIIDILLFIAYDFNGQHIMVAILFFN